MSILRLYLVNLKPTLNHYLNTERIVAGFLSIINSLLVIIAVLLLTRGINIFFMAMFLLHFYSPHDIKFHLCARG